MMLILTPEERLAQRVSARQDIAHVEGWRYAERTTIVHTGNVALDTELVVTTEISLSVVPGHTPDALYWALWREGVRTRIEAEQ